MKTLVSVVGTSVILLAAIVALGLLFSFPVMWLINGLFAPSLLLAVFGVIKISVWQAWGLIILFSFLFKNSTSSKE